MSDVEIAAVGVILIGFHVERADNRSSARSGSKESDAAALCAVGRRRTIANNQMIDDQHAGVFQTCGFAFKNHGVHFRGAGDKIRKQSVDGRGACLGERRGIVKRPAIADLRVVQANDALVFKRAVYSRSIGRFNFPEVRKLSCHGHFVRFEEGSGRVGQNAREFQVARNRHAGFVCEVGAVQRHVAGYSHCSGIGDLGVGKFKACCREARTLMDADGAA